MAICIRSYTLIIRWVGFAITIPIITALQISSEDRYYYGVRIVTGSQQACSAKARDVFFTVAGTESQSNKISLGFFQRLAEWDSFQEDTHDDMII